MAGKLDSTVKITVKVECQHLQRRRGEDRRSRPALFKWHEASLALLPRHILIHCIKKPKKQQTHLTWWITLVNIYQKRKQKAHVSLQCIKTGKYISIMDLSGFLMLERNTVNLPPLPHIYIYVCVCPGFAIVTWFLSAIISHKGLKVTSGAINHCEEKIVQIIIIASLF